MMDNGCDKRGTPEELRPIEAALDVVGQGERDSAPVRLEQGVFLASYGRLRGAGHPAGQDESPVVAGRISGMSARMRLAASVALAGAVAAAWLGYSAMFNRVGPGGTPVQVASNGLEDDVNFVLDLRSSSDDLAILGERIDTLFIDTGSVGDSLRNDSSPIMLGDGAL